MRKLILDFSEKDGSALRASTETFVISKWMSAVIGWYCEYEYGLSFKYYLENEEGNALPPDYTSHCD